MRKRQRKKLLKKRGTLYDYVITKDETRSWSELMALGHRRFLVEDGVLLWDESTPYAWEVHECGTIEVG